MGTVTTVATPAPEATPATEPLDTSVAEVGEEAWETLNQDFDTDPEVAAVEGDLIVPDTSAAGAPPATEVKTEEVPVALVTPTDEAKPAEPAPFVPEVPAAPPIDAVKWEAEQLKNLEALYSLGDEEALAFATEPELVLPKLAAAMHLRITKSILASVQGLLPQMMQAQTITQTTEQAARQTFYSANPDLNKPEFETAVLQVGAMYRKVNPRASAEEASKKIGEMARLSLGLPQLNAPAPAAPVAQKPFSPARGGSGGGVPAAQPSVWEDLARRDEF